jgi:DNA sulfur modification protein DndE
MSLEIVRVSQQGKEQLIKLKRLTGIKNWNTLCRWALCASLRDDTRPLIREINTDSNIEMTWRTFGGASGDAYLALLRHRCHLDRLEPTVENLTLTLNAHLHRGIGYLAGDPQLRSIEALMRMSTSTTVIAVPERDDDHEA